MTDTPDEPDQPADGGSASGGQGPRRKLDEDAAWRDIVAHYGDRAELGPEPPSSEPPATGPGSGAPGSGAPASGAPGSEEPPREERLRGLFQPSWNDPLDTGASWDDEGHFVPPPPPPMPVLDPRRRLAWAGLFGSPVIMLLVVVLGWRLPDWAMFGLSVAFAGGFVYLVATMSNRRPGDGPGDDGAVV